MAIYLISNSDKTTEHLQEALSGFRVLLLEAKNEVFGIDVKDDDMLILSVEKFGNVNHIMAYLQSLPKNLKVIAIKEKPNLAEGTLLVKKGVKSYFHAQMPPQTITQVIQIVLDGNTWVYPQLMTYIINQVSNTDTTNEDVLMRLTPKEKEVALLVASGNSNAQIAQVLDVALITVKKHIGSIFDKLDVRDRVSLSIMVNKPS